MGPSTTARPSQRHAIVRRHVALFPDDRRAGADLGKCAVSVTHPTEVLSPIANPNDDAQGRGLGLLLFLRLMAAAAERGITTLRTEVLATNHRMLGLLRRIAPGAEIVHKGTTNLIIVPTAGVAPDAPLPPK